MTVDPGFSVGLRSLLIESRTRLASAGIKDPMRDVRLLATETTGLAAIDLMTGTDRKVSDDDARRLRSIIERRAHGEPVHRILGYREFFGLRLSLTESTLEPRPDTETLVELVLPRARDFVDSTGACDILDLGTGTGAVALAVLNQVADCSAVGTDISASALGAAAKNARAHGLEGRFETIRSNWFENVNGRFHLIVANPPYIATDEIELLEIEVRCHDPVIALDGGSDGLEAYRRIARKSREFLHPGGFVAVETGFDRRESVSALFRAVGFVESGNAVDLAGRDRALLFAG